MFRSFRAPTHSFFIPLLLTFACGGQPRGKGALEMASAAGAAGEDAASAESGSAGDNEQGEGGRAETTKPPKGGSGGRGGSSGTASVDSAGSDAGGANAGGAAGEAGTAGDNETPACVNTGLDTPDDDFIDSNCDGIDGDLTRAVFVSPDGSDGAEGTLATPLRRIDDAIELAATSGRDVYVCNGTYSQAVTITKPVALYGGYTCENGARRTKDRAVIQPDRGVALFVQNVTGTVHLERLAFRSPDAVSPSESSQAGSIVASSDVTFSRVEFSAGKGADGAPGAPGADASQVAPFKGAPGGNAPTSMCNINSMTDACGSTPAQGFDAQLIQTCETNGVTSRQRGGSGGGGANVWLAQGRPTQFGGTSISTSGIGNDVGTYELSEGVFKRYAAEQASQPGEAGADGEDARLGFGAVKLGVYVASNRGLSATDGSPGSPGIGGSGGKSVTVAGEFISTTFYVSAGGGQGGVGGCGGKGAKGGGAGGGSIALVVDNSNVSLELSQLVTSAGGKGQDGQVGGRGQPGGNPGHPGTAATAIARPSPGAKGGDGGRGGDSGAGAGGPSIGIAYIGSAPVVSDTTYVIGEGGRGGISMRRPSVVNGVSADLYPITEMTPI